MARSRFPCLGMGDSRSFVGLSHISWDPLACRSNLQPSRSSFLRSSSVGHAATVKLPLPVRCGVTSGGRGTPRS